MVEKSDSFPELRDSFDETDLIMSGAFKACTLVVEMSSVGREIMFLRIVPGAYLEVPERVSPESTESSPRLMRFVNARAKDIVEEV